MKYLTLQDKLWNVEVNYNGAKQTIVYFKGTITSNNSAIIYQATTPKVMLVTGQNTFVTNTFQTIYQTINLLPKGEIEEGVYEFTTEIFDNNNVLLNSVRDEISYKKSKEISIDTTEKKIVFNLNGSVTGQYDYTKGGDDYHFEPDYIRLQLNPTLTILGIPITSSVFITNENKNTSADFFNFSFDYNQYKQLLNLDIVTKTMGRLDEHLPGNIKVEDALKGAYMKDKFKEYSDMAHNFDFKTLEDKIQSYMQLDVYKDFIFKNKNVKDALDKTSGLRSFFDINNGFDVSNLKDKVTGFDLQNLNDIKDALKLDSLPKVANATKIMAAIQSANITELKKYYTNPELILDSLKTSLKHLDRGSIESLYTNENTLLDLTRSYNIKDIDSLYGYLRELDLYDIGSLAKVADLQHQYDALTKKCEKLPLDKKDIKKYEAQFEELKQMDKGDLTQMLNDPKYAMMAADKLNLLTKKQKFLMGVKDVQVYHCNPQVSALTVNGMPLRGVSLAYENKAIIGFTAGKIKGINVIDTTQHHDTLSQSLDTFLIDIPDRSLYTVSLGYQIKDKMAVKVNYLFSKDKENTTIGHPSINQVISTELKTISLKNIELKAEGAYSINKNIDSLEKKDKGFAAQLSGNWNIPYTPISLYANASYIGAGFVSHGLPYVVNDVLQYELGITHSDVKGRMVINIYYRGETENMHNQNGNKREIKTINLSMNLNFEGLPYVQITYAPYFIHSQTRDSIAGNTKSYNATYSILTGYQQQLSANLSLNSQLSYFNTTLYGSDYYANEGHSVGINYQGRLQNIVHALNVRESLTWKKMLTIFANASINIPQKSTQSLNRIYTIENGVTLVTKKNFLNTIGVQYAGQHGENVQHKLGFYANSRIPICKFLELDVTVKDNYLQQITDLEKNIFKGISIYSNLLIHL